MATVWKTIKPKQVKEKEMRLPWLNAMRRMATKIRNDFQQTTATWQHKVTFNEEISLSVPPGPKVTISTTDEIYGYVDKGTKPHLIRPVKAKALHFKSVFTAKTMPGVIGSQAGGSSGDEDFTQVVAHPGSQARGFDKAIAQKWKPLFRQEIEQVMREVAQKSGHAMR